MKILHAVVYRYGVIRIDRICGLTQAGLRSRVQEVLTRKGSKVSRRPGIMMHGSCCRDAAG